MSINISTGPSSWDRDMQGMPGTDEEESDNLAALGMHITDDDKDDDKDEDDDEDEVEGAEAEQPVDDEDKEEEIDVDEVDELEELDHLAKKLKEEEAPALIDDMDE